MFTSAVLLSHINGTGKLLGQPNRIPESTPVNNSHSIRGNSTIENGDKGQLNKRDLPQRVSRDSYDPFRTLFRGETGRVFQRLVR